MGRVDYIGDNKFISFLLKPKVKEGVHFDNLTELMYVSKKTFEKYRQRDTESFFICAQELGENSYIWYWELMPDVVAFKEKYGKSLHTSFKMYLTNKLENNGRIYIFVAHLNHPNYIAMRYVVPDKLYFDKYIELIRTFKMDFVGAAGEVVSPPVGRNFDMIKLAIKDTNRRIAMYYNILKYSVDVVTI